MAYNFTPYHEIARAVALRANQLEGGDAALRREVYNTNSDPLTTLTLHMDGVEVPYEALKQDILAQEAELVAMIATSTNHLFKTQLLQASSFISSGDALPAVSALGTTFIGNLEGVYEKDTHYPLTEKTKQEVLRRVINPDTVFKLPVRHFCIDGGRVFHTVGASKAYVKAVAWDFPTQSSAFDSEGVSKIPRELASLWEYKILGSLAQENWFVNEAGYYRNMAAAMSTELIAGRAQALALPTIPQTTANADPVKN